MILWQNFICMIPSYSLLCCKIEKWFPQNICVFTFPIYLNMFYVIWSKLVMQLIAKMAGSIFHGSQSIIFLICMLTIVLYSLFFFLNPTWSCITANWCVELTKVPNIRFHRIHILCIFLVRLPGARLWCALDISPTSFVKFARYLTGN